MRKQPRESDSRRIVVYGNSHSLFDFTNGAARSIRLILETIANSGGTVYAITTCVSGSKAGSDYSQRIWERERKSAGKDHHKIIQFYKNGVNYTLINTPDYQRQKLTSADQELVYRACEMAFKKHEKEGKTITFLSWGNLLLEEALFQRAKQFGHRTIFYLANPSYLGKDCTSLTISSSAITDSAATKALYAAETKAKISVLPKLFDLPGREVDENIRFEKQTISLVNPCIRKGLEPFLYLARHFNETGRSYRFNAIDAAGCLATELKKLGLSTNDLPKNITVQEGNPEVDSILKDTTIILLLSLWHESGSRLIDEGQCRGIPVLAFRTGGTPDLMRQTPEDLFNGPGTDGTWEARALIQRLDELLRNQTTYTAHSKKLKTRAIAQLVERKIKVAQYFQSQYD